MQKYYHYYDDAYRKFTPDWFDETNLGSIKTFLSQNSESLISFIESYADQFNWPKDFFKGKNVLVTGCGFGGLCQYLITQGAFVTGFDVSNLAIMGAKEIDTLINGVPCVDYKNIDLTHSNLDQYNNQFDFIIDDHLLHCLASNEDRLSYMNNLSSLVTQDGLIFIESMAFHSDIKFPINYSFDEDHILYKNINDKDIMIRKISPSIEIENEIKNSNLFINYLYFHSELSFQAFSEYEDYPHEHLPKTIRLTCKKAQA